MTTARKADKTENAFAALFKLPNFDIDAAMDAHRKNVEALIEANRVAFEGYKTASEKQVDHMRKAADKVSGATSDLLNGKTPEANASKQAEVVQDIARKGFDAFRELSELTLSANREAFSIVQKRMTQCMEELKGAQEKAAEKVAAAAKQEK